MKRIRMTDFTGGRRHLLALALFGVSGGAAAAELWTEAGAVDKFTWACEYCPYEQGLEGEITLGTAYVPKDRYAFGNYTGFDQDGYYGLFGADIYYRGEDAEYFRLNAARLGLDTGSVRLEGGRQGHYRGTLDYVQIPRLHTDEAMTPYTGIGGEDLRLPEGWLEAGTTATMPGLNASLRPIKLRTDRERVAAGFLFTPDAHWSHSVNFRRDHKEGLKVIGGSFAFNGVLLPEPVDYTTEQVELGLGYTADHWQVRLGYLGSFFRNANDRLRFDNPFIDPVGHTNEGQMALPPDNTFHQLTLAGSYRFGTATQLTARLAGGRMSQDEKFLPYTVNPLLTTTALPSDSLQGEVRTYTFDARLVSAAIDKLTLQANLRYNERDNRTPQNSFDTVSTDVFLAGQRTNALYNHIDRSVGASGRYRATPDTRLSAGAEYEEKSRSDWEVEQTQETTLWAEVASQLHPTTDLMLRIARADRDASELKPLVTGAEAQNPLLVKFNLAARDQRQSKARLHVTPVEYLDFGLEVTHRDNDYTDTSIGLRSSRDTSATFDAMLQLTQSLNLHAFITRENHENEQVGSQSFSIPDWFATAEDIIDSHGFGFAWRPADSDVEFGFDYVFSEATGKIDLRGGTAFPDLKSAVRTANAHLRYRLTDMLSTELALFYEEFENDDWMVDNVAPSTIPSVLTLGADSPDYTNRAIALMLHYQF
jgi:MtrB/PioB family decaheme-associated outer membrane protein